MRAQSAAAAARHADLEGARFGRLTILEIIRSRPNKAKVLCSCGKTKTIRLSHIESGATNSCGCLFIEATRQTGESNVTHGMKKTPEYAAWANMHYRCNTETSPAFPSYGGRGIAVCDRWQSFKSFYDDIGPRPSRKHSLERVENDKGYGPSNCIWALPHIQNANRRTTRHLTAFGETRTLMDWCAIFSIKRSTVSERLRRGWSAEDAISSRGA